MPFTSGQLQEIFRMAINQEPPFKGEGTGFQDAVIYRSIMNDVPTGHEVTAAFITRDGDFKSMVLFLESGNAKRNEIQILPIEAP